MKMLRVKNWEKFQHYKDRCPPWIKLATDTFQNYDFGRLHDASKLLAVCIWTLAARTTKGEVPLDLGWVKSQCSLGDSVNQTHLQELIAKGYLEIASNPLADCKQSASPEGERETEAETEAEGEGEAENIVLEDAPRSSADATPKPKVERGERLESYLARVGDEQASQELGMWAIKELGLPHAVVNAELQKFEDYWKARAGAGGCKRDWPATWRNWMRRVRENIQKEEARNEAFRRNKR